MSLINNIISFIGLDYHTIKQNFSIKNHLAIIFFCLAFVGLGIGSETTIAYMLMCYGSLQISSVFAACEINGLDSLYASLPIAKKDVVVGRYLFALLLNLMVGIASFFITCFILFVFNIAFSTTSILVTIIVCFVIFTVLHAILLPLYFKFGYHKAESASYLAIIGLPVVLTIAGRVSGKNILRLMMLNTALWIRDNFEFTIILTVIIWTIVMISSCYISYCIYRKREF